MNLSKRIAAISSLGAEMKRQAKGAEDSFRTVCRLAYEKNNWLTPDNISKAFLEWADLLTQENLSGWLQHYDADGVAAGKKIGVINAGNIPLVGMHDFISVLLCGHFYTGKNSSEDQILLPYLAELLTDLEPEFINRIQFVERLSDFHAVIATGSNNSARYFESYFGKYPYLIRKNRNGVGVLGGNESSRDLEKLGEDIFQYFGLGCRNVSKLYVPQQYEFTDFFETMYSFSNVMQHNKYMNNFDYNNTMLLMKQVPFLQNGFLILREEERISSPIAVIHYERYAGQNQLAEKLDAAEEQIQCIATNENLLLRSALKDRVVKFGTTQSPGLSDYADGADTIRFLLSI